MQTPTRAYFIFITLTFFAVFYLSGCSGLTENLANNLSTAIKNNNDLEVIKDGSPAYLIMIDSFIEDSPDNENLLRTAADLNNTYAEIFIEDPLRKKKMTQKAFNYAKRSCCNYEDDYCGLDSISFQEFNNIINKIDDRDDIPYLFTLGSSWAGMIQADSENFKALANISRIEAIMKMVEKIDENYMDGAVHLYLASLAILLPPSLGGKPELAKEHFEKAVKLSGNKNLMVKVMYADKYGKMMFDQELYNRLLGEVIQADPKTKGFTLINTLAQKKARILLEQGAEYF
jgi:hypothetical protein